MAFATAIVSAAVALFTLAAVTTGSVLSEDLLRQAGSCHASKARCAGAPNRPFVQWKPCCNSNEECLPASDWGSVCRTRSQGGYGSGQCHASGVKCQGAPGKPFVEWKPCCKDTDQCVPVTNPDDWGYVCRGSGDGPTKPAPGDGDSKCHNTNVKCEGAPGRPFVQWKPCCKEGDSCLSDESPNGWGKVCRSFGGGDSDQCHKTNVKCQGAPGKPPIQWKPCCDPSDSCLPVTDPNDWGYTCRSSSTGPTRPATTTAGTRTVPPTLTSTPTTGTGPSTQRTTTMSVTVSSGPGTSTTRPTSSTQSSTQRPSSTTSGTTQRPPSSTTTTTSSTSRATITTTTSSTSRATTTTRATPTTTAGGVCGRGRSTRRDVRTISSAEWDRYAAAVNALNQRGTGQTIFERFVQSHVENADQGHRGAYFLPWHRQMIYEYEQELKAIDPSVSIPYWDWSTVNTDFKRDSRLWNRYGGARTFQPIPNAPFRNWNTRVPNQHNILRGFNTGDDHAENVWFVDRGNLDVLIADTEQSFATFGEYLEGVHNTPHVAIGGERGDMNNFFSSPNDPVFYSHHAFIDKVWRDWQLAGAGNKFGGLHFNRPASLDTALNPWGRTVRQILEGISDCVTYQESPDRPPRATPVTAARFAERQSLFNATFLRQVREEAAATAEPVKLDTYQDKRIAQKEVAEEKINDPLGYRTKCLAAETEKNAIDAACVVAGFPRDMIERVKKSYEALKLLTGVNVKDAPVIAQASTEEIKQEGEEQAAKLDAGEAPTRTDDSDVKEASS